MKIRLKYDLPVDPRHGMTKGRELEVVRTYKHRVRGDVKWTVRGDQGDEVGVFSREAEVVQPTDAEEG